jgi:hypothetical protein
MADNLDGLFQGKTAPYNAAAPAYGGMPQQVNFPAFMPGQQEGIAQQLSQGYGASPQSYMDQMNALYRPVNMTQLSEPLTASMRAWGLKPSGRPGVVEPRDGGFNPSDFQQYGMQTGSPWLDAMFGLQAQMGVPGATPAPVVDPKKKKPGTSTGTPSTSTAAPAPYRQPMMNMGDRQTGGIW